MNQEKSLNRLKTLYNKFICLCIDHKNVKFQKSVFQNWNISGLANQSTALLTINEDSMIIKFEGSKIIKALIKPCERCGVYIDSSIEENPNYLTEEERAIKDIIE